MRESVSRGPVRPASRPCGGAGAESARGRFRHASRRRCEWLAGRGLGRPGGPEPARRRAPVVRMGRGQAQPRLDAASLRCGGGRPPRRRRLHPGAAAHPPRAGAVRTPGRPLRAAWPNPAGGDARRRQGGPGGSEGHCLRPSQPDADHRPRLARGRPSGRHAARVGVSAGGARGSSFQDRDGDTAACR